MPRPFPKGYPEMAPDLAVEVVSPSDTAEDLQQKVGEYLVSGTRLVWVIYPDTKSVTVFTPGGQARVLGVQDTLNGEDVLPGFIVPPSPPSSKPSATARAAALWRLALPAA